MVDPGLAADIGKLEAKRARFGSDPGISITLPGIFSEQRRVGLHCMGGGTHLESAIKYPAASRISHILGASAGEGDREGMSRTDSAQILVNRSHIAHQSAP